MARRRTRTNIYQERAARYQRYVEQQRRDEAALAKQAQRDFLTSRRLDLQERGLQLRERQQRLQELNMELASRRLETQMAAEEAKLRRSIVQQEQLPLAQKAISEINPADPTAERQVLEIMNMYPEAYNGNASDVRSLTAATNHIINGAKKERENAQALAKEYGVPIEDLIVTNDDGTQRFDPTIARQRAQERSQQILRENNLRVSSANVDPVTGLTSSVSYKAEENKSKVTEPDDPGDIRKQLKERYNIDIPPAVLFGSPYRPVGGIETDDKGNPIGFLPPPEETGNDTALNRLGRGAVRLLSGGNINLAEGRENMQPHDQVGFEFRATDGSMQYRAIPRSHYDEIVSQYADAYNAGLPQPTQQQSTRTPINDFFR